MGKIKCYILFILISITLVVMFYLCYEIIFKTKGNNKIVSSKNAALIVSDYLKEIKEEHHALIRKSLYGEKLSDEQKNREKVLSIEINYIESLFHVDNKENQKKIIEKAKSIEKNIKL